MIKINILSFGQLKNAEHVSFFTNVKVAVEKIGISSLGIAEAQIASYKSACDEEQDIVNRSMASVYTPEMEAMDKERDRLFRLIRLKMQECGLATAGTESAKIANTVQRYLLDRYGNDVCTLPYQEESAVISGFILDINTFLGDEGIETLGIEREVASLESANTKFADQYNERVTEKSGTSSELTDRLRKATEEQYNLLCAHLEYKCNLDASEVGEACASLVAIINQLIADARLRLNVRLGKTDENTDGDVVSPVK